MNCRPGGPTLGAALVATLFAIAVLAVATTLATAAGARGVAAGTRPFAGLAGGVHTTGARESLTTRPAAGNPKKKRRTRKKRAASHRRRAAAPARPAAPMWSSTHGVGALSSELGSILDSRTRNGRWGAIVVSLTRGDTLFEQNADAMLQPASTMKMYTAALALDAFGPDHKFLTKVFRDADVGSDGVLSGNLFLRGDGDPSLSPRFWRNENPMDVLAQQVAAAGIRRVTGDVVADASAFDDQRVPDGWQPRYLGAAYAARVSPLSLHENLVWVVVQPVGRTASVTLDPATTTIPVESTVRVTGGGGGRISAVRRADGVIVVRGSVGARSGPLRYSLVVDDPALFTGGALHAALAKAGVVVDGTVRRAATPANATQVAAVASQPLASIVTEMNRESINLFAELLARDAARAAMPAQPASAETAQATLRDFLSKKVGASGAWVHIADGSGLSVLDSVTPRSMVHLLGYAHRAPWGPTFHGSLPLEGESGTLRRHGRATPAQANLHAKTGTTNTVASLGGYVTARDGEVIAFSFIYNGTDRWNAKTTMDQMGATLAAFVRD